MLVNLKKNPALMFKILKSIYIFKSKMDLFMNTFEWIFDVKQVQYCVYSSHIAHFFLL